MPKTPSWFFKGRVCCHCGSDKTHIKNTGSPLWLSCKCGKENCTKYLCYDCFNALGRLNTRKVKISRLNCHICENKINIDKDYYKCYDNKGNWDGKSYLCKKCYLKQWYIDTVRPMRQYMDKKIDINNIGQLNQRQKGLIFECIAAKVLKVNNYNINSENYNSLFDIKHELYNKIQVKGRSYDIMWKRWKFEMKHNMNYDTAILIGVDENWKNIKIVYIIPFEYIEDTIQFKLEEVSTFDQFKINSQPYDDAYLEFKSIGGNNGLIDIKDIEKWLNNYSSALSIAPV